MCDAAAKVQLSVSLPASTVAAFDIIARALDRDRTWVMLEAFSAYLKGEGRHILEEAEGIAELERGESVDFDEAMVKSTNSFLRQSRRREKTNSNPIC